MAREAPRPGCRRVAGLADGGPPTGPVSYEDSVIEALRWGWVDSTQKPVDDDARSCGSRPAGPASIWTRPNKARIARLEAEGRLEAPGRAAVEAAQANGNWTLMDAVDDRVVPDDLAAAFAARPGRASTGTASRPRRRSRCSPGSSWPSGRRRARSASDAIAEAAARGEKAVG